MATVIPFRGIIYNPRRVSGDDVYAPPYDIISPGLKRQLYGRSPYNIVRIDFGMEEAGDDEAGEEIIADARAEMRAGPLGRRLVRRRRIARAWGGVHGR